jgi:hypothetical protein
MNGINLSQNKRLNWLESEGYSYEELEELRPHPRDFSHELGRFLNATIFKKHDINYY